MSILSSKGFTLVELSIVMIVVGLLLGGTLKGQELIENARVSKFVSDFQSYRAAQYAFIDRYNEMPGDMPDTLAQARVPNCDISNNCTGPGNGDRRIDLFNNASGGFQDNANIVQESNLYWKHLALAGFVNGIQFNAPTLNHDLEPGISNPASFGGSMWGVTYITFAGYFPSLRERNVYYISRDANRIAVGSGNYTVPARIAAAIDQKMDDGFTHSGEVSGNCYSYQDKIIWPPYVPAVKKPYDVGDDSNACFVSVAID